MCTRLKPEEELQTRMQKFNFALAQKQLKCLESILCFRSLYKFYSLGIKKIGAIDPLFSEKRSGLLPKYDRTEQTLRSGTSN